MICADQTSVWNAIKIMNIYKQIKGRFNLNKLLHRLSTLSLETLKGWLTFMKKMWRNKMQKKETLNCIDQTSVWTQSNMEKKLYTCAQKYEIVNCCNN